MEEKSDWATPSLKEVLWWRNGMTVDEYEEERTYYYEHFEEVRKGTYKPLWNER